MNLPISMFIQTGLSPFSWPPKSWTDHEGSWLWTHFNDWKVQVTKASTGLVSPHGLIEAVPYLCTAFHASFTISSAFFHYLKYLHLHWSGWQRADYAASLLYWFCQQTVPGECLPANLKKVITPETKHVGNTYSPGCCWMKMMMTTVLMPYLRVMLFINHVQRACDRSNTSVMKLGSQMAVTVGRHYAAWFPGQLQHNVLNIFSHHSTVRQNEC